MAANEARTASDADGAPGIGGVVGFECEVQHWGGG
jgi:hypothetical protein